MRSSALKGNGVHSNGLTLAPKGDWAGWGIVRPVVFPNSAGPWAMNCSAQRTSTRQEILPLLDAEQDLDVKALCHVTGDGFLNLSRVPVPVSFVIETFPSPPPIFSVIQKLGGIADPEMFEVFNMGIGFLSGGPGTTSRQDAGTRHEVWEKSLPARAGDGTGTARGGKS